MIRFTAALPARFSRACRRSIGPLLTVTTALIVAPLAAFAQQPAVHLTVTDTAGHSIAGAEGTILDATNTVRAESQTDAAGHAPLALPRESATYELRARRIGYAAATHAIRASSEPVRITLPLIALPQQLATVKVTAAESEKLGSRSGARHCTL